MNTRLLALSLLLSLSAAACASSTTPEVRTRTAPPAKTVQSWETRITPEASPLHVPGAPLQSLLYVKEEANWPKNLHRKEVKKAPRRGAIHIDSKGDAWVVDHPPGLSFRDQSTALAQSPSAPANPAAVLLENGDSPLPTKPRDTDSFVFIRDADGPLIDRIAGSSTVFISGTDPNSPQKPDLSAERGQLIALRTESLPAEALKGSLHVVLDQSACNNKERADEINKALLIGLRYDMPFTASVTITEEGGAFHSDADHLIQIKNQCGPDGSTLTLTSEGAPLFRTPFWSPTTLTVPVSRRLDAAIAAILSHQGFHARSLRRASQIEVKTAQTERLKAGLALQRRWSTDTLALLKGATGEEEKLLLAGAHYSLGNSPTTLELLNKASSTRAILARASLEQAWASQHTAEATVREALKKAKDKREQATLQLGLLELLLKGGVKPADFATEVENLQKLRNYLYGDQISLFKRYKAVNAGLQGQKGDVLSLYQSSAESYQTYGHHRQAAVLWQKIAQEDQSEDTWNKAVQAALLSRDMNTLASTHLLRFLSGIEAALQDENARARSKETHKEAMDAALRAGRMDYVATLLRYKLLLLPDAADLKTRIKAVKEALVAARDAGDPRETAGLLSLLSRYEAAGMNYEKAEKTLEDAISLAASSGDKELEAVFREELKALQNQ